MKSYFQLVLVMLLKVTTCICVNFGLKLLQILSMYKGRFCFSRFFFLVIISCIFAGIIRENITMILGALQIMNPFFFIIGQRFCYAPTNRE